MTCIRFETAADVFEAFPVLAGDMSARPSGETPAAFIAALTEGDNPFEALTFSAYVLPRREAVRWYCHSLRMIKTAGISANDFALRLAEAWVRDPSEERRIEALMLVEELDKSKPASWAAIAAAWSGGSLAQPSASGENRSDGSKPAAPFLVAKAVRAGFSLLIPLVPSGEQRDTIRLSIAEALRIATSETA